MAASTITFSDATQHRLYRLRQTASGRRMRLFACACVRDVGLYLRESASRQAIAVAERFADGEATAEDLRAAYARAEAAREAVYSATRNDWRSFWRVRNAACAAKALLLHDDRDAALQARRALLEFGGRVNAEAWNAAAQRAHGRFLADVFGDFDLPPRLDPGWLRWNDGCVAKMARSIYDERRWEDVPILADALEEAGCDEPDLLAHCREPGEHVRGCWAVDMLLETRREDKHEPLA